MARRSKSLPMFALLLGQLISAPARAAEPEWEYEDTRDGIALHTREVAEHSYDVVKAVVTLDARPETLLSLLRDIEHYPRWYHGCKQTRLLSRPPQLAPVRFTPQGRFVPQAVDESYELFFLQDMPSIEDRWAIVKNRVHIARDGSLVITFSSLDKRSYRAPKNAERMRLRGRWVLTPLSRQRTRVTFILDIDPHTAAPAFLVDPKIHATAIATLRNLRKLAAQPHSIELGRALVERRPALQQ